jgi:hypothetical protein
MYDLSSSLPPSSPSGERLLGAYDTLAPPAPKTLAQLIAGHTHATQVCMRVCLCVCVVVVPDGECNHSAKIIMANISISMQFRHSHHT